MTIAGAQLRCEGSATPKGALANREAARAGQAQREAEAELVRIKGRARGFAHLAVFRLTFG